jgi:hypothetical protein
VFNSLARETWVVCFLVSHSKSLADGNHSRLYCSRVTPTSSKRIGRGRGVTSSSITGQSRRSHRVLSLDVIGRNSMDTTHLSHPNSSSCCGSSESDWQGFWERLPQRRISRCWRWHTKELCSYELLGTCVRQLSLSHPRERVEKLSKHSSFPVDATTLSFKLFGSLIGRREYYLSVTTNSLCPVKQRVPLD